MTLTTWASGDAVVGSSGEVADSSASTSVVRTLARYVAVRVCRAGREGVIRSATGHATLERVRLTHFRVLMAEEFGSVRATSLATDHVFAELGGRTVNEALEAGVQPRDAWRAVCAAFEVPLERR
jgi:hypothetical protein